MLSVWRRQRCQNFFLKLIGAKGAGEIFRLAEGPEESLAQSWKGGGPRGWTGGMVTPPSSGAEVLQGALVTHCEGKPPPKKILPGVGGWWAGQQGV